MMRCIVIDDEKPALDLTCSYIAKIPFLTLAGTFSDPFDAMNFLMKNQVELIFSDIEMNGINGINGVQFVSCLNNLPMVIFITANDQYAIDGYALNAIDYLLKPVSFERFLKAVNKAYKSWSLQEITPPASELSSARVSAAISDYLFVKTDNRLVKLFFHDILFVEGYGDYIKYHLREGRIVLSLQNMGALEAKLPTGFIRVHRSYIVAIDKIEEIERKRIKIGKHTIPISESYQEVFFARLNN